MRNLTRKPKKNRKKHIPSQTTYSELPNNKYAEINSIDLPDNWKRYSKRWGHSLHTICARTGSFPPRLVNYFISKYSQPGDRVLDLYSGKGTTALEACLLGRRGVGNDLCPDAYSLTVAKVNPPDKSVFLQYLTQVKNKLKSFPPQELDNINVEIYYDKGTLEEILKVREIVREDELASFEKRDKTLKTNVDFLKALMLGILHGRAYSALSLPMPHSFSMAPTYVQRKIREEPLKFSKPYKNVLDCLFRKTEQVYKNPVPEGFLEGEAHKCDASKLELETPVDLIITSPPYLNAHTYAWDNWLRLWFLGYQYRDIRKLLLETGSEEIYLEKMHQCLRNMSSLLKNNSRCFIVVGDVRGHEPLANLLADLVTENYDIGFSVQKIILDNVESNRKYLYGDNNHHGIKTDRILELHKGKPAI